MRCSTTEKVSKHAWTQRLAQHLALITIYLPTYFSLKETEKKQEATELRVSEAKYSKPKSTVIEEAKRQNK